jgi:hypothetical protein
MVNYPTLGLTAALIAPSAGAPITKPVVVAQTCPCSFSNSHNGFDGLQDLGQGIARIYKVLSMSSNSTAHPSNNTLYWHWGTTSSFEY